MVLLVDILVEQFCMKKTVTVVKTYLLKHVVHKKLENKFIEGRNCFCVIWNVVFYDMLDEEENKF
jgi:hypothetical protein